MYTKKILMAGMLMLASPFALTSNALAEDLVPLEYFESFDNGIPVTWTIVDGYGDGLTWTFANPSAYNIGAPFTLPFTAVIDSLQSGAAWMDEVLRSPAYDLSRCIGDVTLEFANCFVYYSPNLQEVGDVDVSADGGLTWTNVLRMANDNFGPESRTIDITSIAGTTADLGIRFHYYNARSEFWWLVDDIKVSCMATPEEPEMTLDCDGFAAPMDKVVTVKGRRPILPLRATLRDELDALVTDLDIESAPVAVVHYTAETYDGEVLTPADLIDVTEATDGNAFEYNPATEQWYFHMPLSNYTQSGTYIVTMESTDTDQYEFSPKCEAQFTR